MAIKIGDLITVSYEGREFEAIVIDPDGLGPGLPSVGFGLGQATRYIGIPQPTLTRRVRVSSKNGHEELETPGEKVFRVMQICGSDNNDYKVIEDACTSDIFRCLKARFFLLALDFAR